LEFPYAAFYDLRTLAPLGDLEAIASRPILFRLAVHQTSLDVWEIVGHQPLDEAMQQSFDRFMQSPADHSRCTIVDRAGHERPARPAECVRLERVAVWEPGHVADRLLDVFMQRPNKWVESLKVKL
jgi:hypothetical protein